MTIQKLVTGEATDTYYGFAPEDRIAPPTSTEVAPQVITHEPSPAPAPTPEPVEEPMITVEQPFTEPGEVAENLMGGQSEPTPTVEQRRFSAPQMEWDATR
jgi:hypothetical protein